MRCLQQHPLLRHVGTPLDANFTLPNRSGEINISCFFCSQSCLDKHAFFYRCPDCNFNVCRLCLLQKCDSPQLTSSLQVKPHLCSLEPIPANLGKLWKCSSYKKGTRECEGGMT